jgi:Family of unknown function (DUF6064)
VLTVGLGLALWLALWQGRAWAPRAAFGLLGVAWLWVAWGFHWQRFASINSAAPWYAGAFAIEGLMLLAWVVAKPAIATRGRGIGLALMLVALLAHPAIGAALGLPWRQAAVFGLAPDPTAFGTLGVVFSVQTSRRSVPRWLLWPIPLLWCVIAGLALATLHGR